MELVDKIKELNSSDDAQLANDLLRHNLIYENFYGKETIALSSNQRISIEQFAKYKFAKDIIGEIEQYKIIIGARKRPFLIYFSCYPPAHKNYILPDHNGNDIDIFLAEILIKYSHNRSVFELDNEISIPLFDSLEKIAKSNSVKFLCYCCEKELQVYEQQYKHLALQYLDLYLLKSISFIEDIDDKLYDEHICKKFISLNRRYESHRHIISSFLHNKSSTVSWHFKGSWNKLNKILWFDINKWKTTDPEIWNMLKKGHHSLNAAVPLTLDAADNLIQIKGEEMDFTLNPFSRSKPFLENKLLEDNFRKCFCTIVNLTRFADVGAYIDEKAIMPALVQRPFILAGKPHSLSLMKEYGFITFADFWDESYDEVENNEDRLLCILKLINEIDQYSIKQLKKMLSDMQPILNHNQTIIKKLKEKYFVQQ